VPVDTLQSIFDEPSSGSKATQYLPANLSGTMIGSSSSSETSTAQTHELVSAFTMISLDSTSSFFTSSPEALADPARP